MRFRTTSKASKTSAGRVRVGGYRVPVEFRLDVINDEDNPDPNLVHPNLGLEFAVHDGEVKCVGVHLTAQPKGREVHLSDLRAVSINNLRDTAVQMVADPVEVEEDGEVAYVVELNLTNRDAVAAVNRGRAKVSPARLREVAECVRTCEGRAVVAVQALRGVEERAAQLWIKRARELTDPDTGRPYLEGDGS